MVILKNKFLVKLIASLCIFLTLLNFGLSTRVYAEDEDKKILGGVLLTPVMDLLTAIGDAILDILHSTILEQEESLIRLDGSADNWWSRHGATVAAVVAAIIVVAIVVVTAIPSGGTSALAGAGVLAKLGAACFVIKTAAVAIAAGTVSGFLVARVVDSAMMRDDIYLPVYRITPEEIFANEIAMFDVNFFNPNTFIKELPDTINEIVIHEESNEKNFTVSPNSHYLEINKQIKPFYDTNIERDETGKIIGDKINKDVTNEIIEQLSLIFTPLNANLKHGTKVTASSGHNMTISLNRSPVTQANPYFNYTITFEKGNDIEPYTIFYNYSESGRSKSKYYL